ncbi:uncharacterized protein LOC132976063 [Labrus mixtus]|uniref:uncharacterized protein LOC132976063 n=1 Tax=Labrus mixtus TaxID=508554 RepID=UPI0029BFB615|nr:uncharacterized protein LOC132976063 [Labrus mixtus]
MQFCRKVLCKPCSARVTSPEEDMEYKMGSCIGISHRQANAEAEGLTRRDDRAPLTRVSTSQQSLLSPPVLPEVPVITGVEESLGAEQEDKEELEFPHDLLPSLDFGSEFNIWESTLGAPCSSGGRKSEQVDPLVAGLQHHKEVSGPEFVLGTRPHDDSGPVLTDTQPSPWPSATPPDPDVRPLTSPKSLLLDRELQEAFQECEEQMASLGRGSRTERSASETVCVEGKKKTGEGMVNKSGESSKLPPIVVVQPGHSNKGHGNRSTNGNSEAASNKHKDTVVFSFRNYILGTEDSVGSAETEREIKATQSLDTCSGTKTEKETEQKETPTQTQKSATDSAKGNQKEVLFPYQRDDLKGKHVDSKAAVKEDTEKGTEAKTETADNHSDEVHKEETGKDVDSVMETLECSNLSLKDKDALVEVQAGGEAQTQEGQKSKADKWQNPPQAEQDKKAKKKDKKKQRKKKKSENTEVQPENEKDKSEARGDIEAALCGQQQPDNGFDYEQQLSPEGEHASSPPLSSSQSGRLFLRGLISQITTNIQKPHVA